MSGCNADGEWFQAHRPWASRPRSRDLGQVVPARTDGGVEIDPRATSDCATATALRPDHAVATTEEVQRKRRAADQLHDLLIEARTYQAWVHRYRRSGERSPFSASSKSVMPRSQKPMAWLALSGAVTQVGSTQMYCR